MKTLKQILAITLIFIGSTSFSQSGILEQLKSKAKSENKNILLYFSGSDWCGPCIKFKNKFIEAGAFKSFANQRLLVCNADFPRKKLNQLSKEKTAENEKLAELYNAAGNFPMIVLLDSNGKILKKWESLPSISVERFINELQ